MKILIRPLINEKSMSLLGDNFYTFEVDKDAKKSQIIKVVAEKFSVTPLAVRIINQKGKRKMQRTRRGYYQTSGIKKAVVKLKKGDKIALFEAPTQEVEVRTAEGESLGKVKEKKSLLRGTKVKIEKEPINKEELEKKSDKKVSMKRSQKESKKGGK